jgi:hypothetical protein
VHIQKERFPEQKRYKLMPRGDEPFQILERINDNAYKVDIPGEYDVNSTFNVYDFSLFDVDDYSWMNHFEEKVDYIIKTTLKDPLQVQIGPITRSRVKKLKDALINELIHGNWAKMN